MVAYLEKTDGNADFHEIINFLTRSSIHYALTVSPVVSTTLVEQFWMSTKSKIINNVRFITSKVAGKLVNLSEASIRSDLLFNDADGIDFLHNHAIFDAIQLMGTVKPDEGTDKPKVSTDKPEVSTHAKPKEVEVSTDKLDEGTAEPKDGTSDEILLPTTVFKDDEPLQVYWKKLQKLAHIQIFDDIQARIEADRLLAARLSRVNKDEKCITVEERAKFLYDTIAYQRRKHAELKNKNFEEIQVMYKKVKRSDKDFIAIGSAEDESQIKEMNKESKDPKRKRVVNETPMEEDTDAKSAQRARTRE
ncbi:hypothetical protein Tco_0408361 [Tanacetum coccineum]